MGYAPTLCCREGEDEWNQSEKLLTVLLRKNEVPTKICISTSTWPFQLLYDEDWLKKQTWWAKSTHFPEGAWIKDPDVVTEGGWSQQSHAVASSDSHILYFPTYHMPPNKTCILFWEVRMKKRIFLQSDGYTEQRQNCSFSWLTLPFLPN